MMVACLYHRIGEGKWANTPAFMEQHLSWIAANYRCVLPGDPLKWFRRQVCLTFDDATYDFYHYAYPLIVKLKIKCLLAVPAGFIQESTDLDPAVRLSIPYQQAMSKDVYRTHVPFCTWRELKEIAGSGLVEIASHSMHHQNLLSLGLNLEEEIGGSKRLLEEKLSIPIRTFVYPLGKFDQTIHRQVLSSYQFAMRIGMGANISWQNWSQIIYRILCDNMKEINDPFKLGRTLSSYWFYLLNSLRGR